MDKTAIKNFAVWARKKLIEDIKQKAYEIGITEKEIKEPEVSTSDTIIIGDRTLNKAEMQQRKSLVSRIREKGFNNVIEEVAYTWFNRFIALRFMEVNEYLPTGVRVLSSIEPGKKEPDIIKEALNIDLDIDRELVYRLQDDNDTETLYRYLLVKQCNALKEILPGLFEKIEDYTEILLPSNLLGEGSVIRRLVDDIPEEDFKDQVEIIGWMYQYYISEKKDEVFEGLRKNIKISKENIPAATQLFTPEWIVRYMVENSLGRLWLEGHPNEELKRKWKYYMEEAEQEPEVRGKLEEIRAGSREIRPEDIKVLDPAMGSGHILVYAFDVLYDIYRSEGYSERDIPRLILENNLYGLDIDERAAQLAYFAVMMKARSRSRRIFRERVNLNICAIQESNGFPKEAVDYLVGSGGTGTGRGVDREDIEYLIDVFHGAKEYGSILEVKPVDFDAVERRLEEIRDGGSKDLFEYQYRSIILEKMPALVKQARIMSQKYDVVVTNPPYMGNKGLNNKLKDFIIINYENVKTDLFSVFVVKCLNMSKANGYLGFMTPMVWMFIGSYEKLRRKIINSHTLVSLVQLEYSGFDGATVPICTFILGNAKTGIKGEFIKLTDFKGVENQPVKTLEAIRNKNVYYRYSFDCNNFSYLPGFQIAYWLGEKTLKSFRENKKIGDVAEPRKGMVTADNQRFIRIWTEVDYNNIKFNCASREESVASGAKWFPYQKGGGYRKWYGNHLNVVNWYNDGYELLNMKNEGYKVGSTNHNLDYIFKRMITWNKITSDKFSARISPTGFLFDDAGPLCYVKNEEILLYVLGYFCSKLVLMYLDIINPTMNFQPGDIASLPYVSPKDRDCLFKINGLVQDCIRISKVDWDSIETSWDFKKHPLLAHKGNSASIEQAFENWSAFTENQFNRLKANEEELNRIFIDIYGLQDELSPELDDEDITITRIYNSREDIPGSMKGSDYVLTKEDVIKSFISYAVGCMFGRYSIDAEGLIYAGGDFKDKWKCEDGQRKVRKIVKDEEGKVVEDTWVDATFVPDMDNVLPITDDEYFEDDIVIRFVEFLKVTFGEDTLEENLDYIADTLGRKSSETARQAIRRYFLKEFYKDHVQVYQKKPIYWLFDSGKQDGFKALIYMHRYDEFTVARVRTDYLHKLQKSYEAEIKRLDIIIDSNVSQREKTNARKKKEKILKQMEECLQYDQVIAHVANQRIKIDLDDGVSVNYSKFQGIEVPQGEGRKPLKADLLAKI